MLYGTAAENLNIKPITAWTPVFLWVMVILAGTTLPVATLLSIGAFDKQNAYLQIKDLLSSVNLVHILPFADKIVHFFLFFLLGVFAVIAISLSGRRRYSVSFPSICLIGVGAELMQFLSASRSPCFLDACANVFGLTAGIFLTIGVVALFKHLHISRFS